MSQAEFNRRFVAGLAILIVISILTYIGAVTFLPVPQSGIKYADMAVPFLLGSGFGAVVGSFFHQQAPSTTFPQPTKVTAVTDDPKP